MEMDGNEMGESSSRFKRICVFCGSSQGKKSSYQDAAIELGKELINGEFILFIGVKGSTPCVLAIAFSKKLRPFKRTNSPTKRYVALVVHMKKDDMMVLLLVSRNIDLVYGGGSIGLMGLVSRAVHDGGRHDIGFIPKTLLYLQLISFVMLFSPNRFIPKTLMPRESTLDNYKVKRQAPTICSFLFFLHGLSFQLGIYWNCPGIILVPYKLHREQSFTIEEEFVQNPITKFVQSRVTLVRTRRKTKRSTGFSMSGQSLELEAAEKGLGLVPRISMSSGGSRYHSRFENDLELSKSQLSPQKVQSRKQKNMDKALKLRNKYLRGELTRVFSEDYDYGVADIDRTVLDPRGPYIDLWNKILFIASLTSLFVDPLFFLLPQATADMCIHASKHLQVALTAIRTLADVFYIARIFIGFGTAYVAPSSRVFGRGELVLDRSKIASRYLRRDFWLDILAALPVPQVLIWIVVPSLKRPSMIRLRHLIQLLALSQYILRLYLIFPLGSKINKATGAVLETAWAGAAYNLMLYMLASHILGCLWYLLAIERQEDCWIKVCTLEHEDCSYSFLDCSNVHDPGRAFWFSRSNVTFLCDPRTEFLDYGIYSDAMTSGVTFSGFLMKFYYCLWWAMRNLNCFGQELSPGADGGEITYSMILGVLALVLFGLLIANMQTYLQSNSARLEQWRIMKTDTERWMRHRHLPDELKQDVRKHYEQKWCSTRGVDEEAILQSLPVDLRRIIKRHLCLDLIRKVRLFDMMDEQMCDAICEKLKPRLYHAGTCLIREGDPVNDMLFIIRGRLNSYTTDGGRTGFFNSSLIGPGDFCGEELLTWALDPLSTSGVAVPASTRTVIALTDAEAFALSAEDLRFIASQFRRLNSKQIRQVFKFHSHHWRTWAACCIQAAWFRYKKRKEADQLKKMKGKVQKPLENAVPQFLQVAADFTSYAAKLAASTRRGGTKPKEPDFTAEM